MFQFLNIYYTWRHFWHSHKPVKMISILHLPNCNTGQCFLVPNVRLFSLACLPKINAVFIFDIVLDMKSIFLSCLSISSKSLVFKRHMYGLLNTLPKSIFLYSKASRYTFIPSLLGGVYKILNFDHGQCRV